MQKITTILVAALILVPAMAVAQGSAAVCRAAPAGSESECNPLAPETTAHPLLWPAAHSPSTITTGATERRITTILRRMTLEQKVGQLIQADISTIQPEDLARYPVGSILAGGNSGPYGNERADGATWAKLVSAFHDASVKSGAQVPILFGIDAVHGHSNVVGATIFPHNIGLGAAHDAALIRRIGEATAAEIASTGIDWTFAPTLAVPQDLRWGRSYEGYASDPTLVATYAREMVLGLQGALVPGRSLAANKVAATAKHFVADGGTQGGKDQGDAVIPEAELVARHAQGYPAAIDAGVLTVMISFSSWNGAKTHGNRSLLTDVLKDRMGFAGLVVGDWNGHGQVPGCASADCPEAINAGLDMFMAPDSWKALFENTTREARDGTIPRARLEDAVRRILRVKARLGLLDKPPVRRQNLAPLGAPAHLALAREAAAKSLVLLKNEGGVLPIKPGAKVLITGTAADNMAMQAGGWTVTWQGTDTTAADFPDGQTVGRAIAEAVRDAGGWAELNPEGNSGARPDIAVVVLGEHPYAEFQGDAPDLAYRETPDETALISRLKAQGVRIVTVFLSGRPLFAPSILNASDAFVAAWLPGTQGAGIADVLVARRDGAVSRDFSGKLSFAWPDDARAPVEKPLFPAGYGLSYAHPAHVDPVNEDSRFMLARATSDEIYLQAGTVPAPWRWSVSSEVASRQVDLTAQEDARKFVWIGPGAVAINGSPVNLSHLLAGNFALRLDWRIDTASTGTVRLGLGGAMVDISTLVAAAPRGQTIITRIPIRCFAEAGAKLLAVTRPLEIVAGTGFGLTLKGARIEASGDQPDCAARGATPPMH